MPPLSSVSSRLESLLLHAGRTNRGIRITDTHVHSIAPHVNAWIRALTIYIHWLPYTAKSGQACTGCHSATTSLGACSDRARCLERDVPIRKAISSFRHTNDTRVIEPQVCTIGSCTERRQDRVRNRVVIGQRRKSIRIGLCRIVSYRVQHRSCWSRCRSMICWCCFWMNCFFTLYNFLLGMYLWSS